MTQTQAPAGTAAETEALVRFAAEHRLGAPRKAYLPRRAILRRRRAAVRVYLYDNGFVTAGRDGLVAYRWNEVDTVFQKIVTNRVYGVPVHTRHVFTVHRKDGGTLKLTDFYADVEELGRHINRHVSGAWLPVARQALRDGKAMRFGDVEVRAAGFVTGDRVTPWSEIRDITVVAGTARVLLHGKFIARWSKPVARVPNLPLLVSLVRELRPGGGS